MQKIKASDFKARCLSILDEVERTGEGVIVTKRGKPVARVLPPARPDDESMMRVRIVGDIISPVLPPETWHAMQENDPNPL